MQNLKFDESAERREEFSESQIDEVAALLSGKPPEPETEKPGEDEKPAAERESAPETPEPKTLETLAERLGVNVSELYNVTVPFGGGESPKTLGEIKDMVADINSFELERLTWSEERAKKEADFMRSAQELTEVLSMIPKNAIPRELLQKVAERRTEAKTREDKLLRAAIPDWANEATETADRQLMQSHLDSYGFPPGYLDNLIDHRTVKFIRDAALRKQRIDKALERVQTVRKPGVAPSAPASPPATPRSSRRGRAANQIAQIVDLINKG